MRKQGVVSHYNNQKGFGFIMVEGQDDLWFHISNVTSGASIMVTGVLVEYEEKSTEKGNTAINIDIIGGK